LPEVAVIPAFVARFALERTAPESDRENVFSRHVGENLKEIKHSFELCPIDLNNH
jgi:hypothetical protein